MIKARLVAQVADVTGPRATKKECKRVPRSLPVTVRPPPSRASLWSVFFGRPKAGSTHGYGVSQPTQC